MKVASFKDLMNGHPEATISCLYSGKVVRKLKVENDTLWIDPLEGPKVLITLAAPITYEPWAMDRGNMLFSPRDVIEPMDLRLVPQETLYKICGEGDYIEWSDGQFEEVTP